MQNENNRDKDGFYEKFQGLKVHFALEEKILMNPV